MIKKECNEIRLLASTTTIKYSLDKGITWIIGLDLTYLSNDPINVVIFDEELCLVGTSLGLFYSEDKINWEECKELQRKCITSLIKLKNGGYVAGTISDGIFHSEDGINVWQQTNLRRRWISCLTQCENGDILAGCNSTGIYKSEDDGLVWKKTNMISIPITCIRELENGKYLAGTTEEGIWHSNNKMDWCPSDVRKGFIYTIKTIDDIIYASLLHNGLFYSPNGVRWYKSELPDQTISDIIKTKNGIYIAGIHNFEHQHICVGGNKICLYIMKKKDGHWDKITTIFDKDINAFKEMKDDGIMICANDGVYNSYNNETWIKDENISNEECYIDSANFKKVVNCGKNIFNKISS